MTITLNPDQEQAVHDAIRAVWSTPRLSDCLHRWAAGPAARDRNTEDFRAIQKAGVNLAIENCDDAADAPKRQTFAHS